MAFNSLAAGDWSEIYAVLDWDFRQLFTEAEFAAGMADADANLRSLSSWTLVMAPIYLGEPGPGPRLAWAPVRPNYDVQGRLSRTAGS